MDTSTESLLTGTTDYGAASAKAKLDLPVIKTAGRQRSGPPYLYTADTDAELLAIARMRDSVPSNKELARHFGVSPKLIEIRMQTLRRRAGLGPGKRGHGRVRREVSRGAQS